MKGTVCLLFSLFFVLQCYGLANVKGIHAIPDGPDVDIYIGGTRTRTGVPYGSSTGYIPFVAGEYTFQITQQNISPSTQTLISRTFNLQDGVFYTFAAIGSIDNPEEFPLDLFIITDDVEIPSDRGLLRTLYLSPSEVNVDVVTDSGVFWSDISYPGAGEPEYITLSANVPYKVAIEATEGSDVDLAGPTFVTLERDSANTLFVIGLSGSRSSPLTIVFSRDFVTGQVSPTPSNTRTPTQTPTVTRTRSVTPSPTASRSFNSTVSNTSTRSASQSITGFVTRSPFRTFFADDDDGDFTKSPTPNFVPAVTRGTSATQTPAAPASVIGSNTPVFSAFLSRTPFRDVQAPGEDVYSTLNLYESTDVSSSGAEQIMASIFVIFALVLLNY